MTCLSPEEKLYLEKHLTDSGCSELTQAALRPLSGHHLSKSSFVTSILSTFRAQPTTFMPCWTRARATAAPIPTDAPVTSATLPFQRSIITIQIQVIRVRAARCHNVTTSSNPRRTETMYHNCARLLLSVSFQSDS